MDLPRLVAALDDDRCALVTRLFEIVETVGTLDPPPEMHRWIEKLFGSVENVREQRIVRVRNRVTHETTLFNELRARRPMEAKGADDARAEIAKSEGDPFCHPDTATPMDAFGRVRGSHGVTASNIAKYDAWHGVLVFDRHDPMAAVDQQLLADHLGTARRWAAEAHARDPEARYYFLLCNSLWRAGGSIVHGHMQMTLTRGSHYGKVEALRAAAAAYDARSRRARPRSGRDRGDESSSREAAYDARSRRARPRSGRDRGDESSSREAASRGDYFADLVGAHDALGLARRVGDADVFASLTPVKERELVCVAPPGADERALVPALAKALAAHRALGVLSWNLALFLPPLAPDGTDWSSFRAHARLVDRGDPGNRTSDIGAMELYAASVVAADPFHVIAALD